MNVCYAVKDIVRAIQIAIEWIRDSILPTTSLDVTEYSRHRALENRDVVFNWRFNLHSV